MPAPTLQLASLPEEQAQDASASKHEALEAVLQRFGHEVDSAGMQKVLESLLDQLTDSL